MFIIKNIISKDSNNTLNIYIPSTIGIPIIDIPNIHIIEANIRLFVIVLINVFRLNILLVLMVFFRVIILLVIYHVLEFSYYLVGYMLIISVSTVIIISIFNSLFFLIYFMFSPIKIYL